MHIEDGILSPTAWGTLYAASALFVVPGVREIKNRSKENLYYKPFLSMVGVGVFVISCMHIPVPVTGSCSHPCGTPLAAILIGPLATSVITAIALFFQALFLGHGGITTIGANNISMGIAGAISGYAFFKLFRKFGSSVWLAAGVAGFVGDMVTYMVSALELAVSLHGHTSILKQWLIFFMGYGPTQVPLAIAEGIFTAVIIKVMLKRRPDLLKIDNLKSNKEG
ncbi:cobalt/nickel transport system permease protein [Clostridium acetobutylicum]|uniref:Cobalt transport protein CbiM n=1 Tax=Clostridium acetobutylicum (strain ATCC 824 / DSM 792 / JCM 1419 / IAM 19013 / LMG 5710 / NBRC 13948 / NRRL B-527 / VKM B-1787 / 2291 / W) TaxID=272562 RepID=Q97JC1_CLOAB|nr:MULTISPECIES: energy-coupling factor ABC transporter permease [Clostridium]AAK79333.1 Cobalamin biosynthesis protein CbiM [Clostridium acetobutylicum ATCC 824]ADZ20416.1 cobalt transport protein CbiM [Clostridium acetobutylicum EA 2018]AEI33653.1 cobalt transport protein CbiM [Clostridium acetobutylicum DSM 1731]AWV81418.1 energy-coupling factor ABC transporter permease [Clostridium acetobutylicum]MBC2393053.1 energy-coupling factor ABC transporter permease [Clostridium acetobutylicum]